jgi:hypothetical protein
MIDAVIALDSPEGRQGTAVYSCAAEQLIRGKNHFISVAVWMFDKKKLKQFGNDFNFVLEAQKPSEFQLQAEREKAGKLVNYAEDHFLNTSKIFA